MSRREGGSDPVSLGQGKCTRATDKAVLIKLANGDEVWVPQSVVHDDSEVWKLGQAGDVVVQTWWAEANRS